MKKGVNLVFYIMFLSTIASFGFAAGSKGFYGYLGVWRWPLKRLSVTNFKTDTESASEKAK